MLWLGLQLLDLNYAQSHKDLSVASGDKYTKNSDHTNIKIELSHDEPQKAVGK